MTYMYFLTLYFPLNYMASCVGEFLIFQLYNVKQKLKTLMKKYMMQYLHDACAALFSIVSIPQYAAADCEHTCSCSPCCDGEAVICGYFSDFSLWSGCGSLYDTMDMFSCIKPRTFGNDVVLWRMCCKHAIATGQCSVSKSITATTTACRQRYNHEQQPCHSHIFNNQSHQHWQLCHSSVCSRNARFSFLAAVSETGRDGYVFHSWSTSATHPKFNQIFLLERTGETTNKVICLIYFEKRHTPNNAFISCIFIYVLNAFNSINRSSNFTSMLNWCWQVKWAADAVAVWQWFSHLEI